MVKINIEVEGTAPLLMNRFSVEEGSKRKKKVYNPKEEAERKSYRTSEGKLMLPSTHFKASMIKAASDFKMSGKKTYKDYVKSGVFITPMEIELDEQTYTIHEEPVVIQRSRVMSWRPRFDKWSCRFEIEITDESIDPETLIEVLETAGKYKGVGDHRPEYGRFIVKNYKIV